MLIRKSDFNWFAILELRVDNGRKIKVAGLPGQWFIEKIQNGKQRFTLD